MPHTEHGLLHVVGAARRAARPFPACQGRADDTSHAITRPVPRVECSHLLWSDVGVDPRQEEKGEWQV